MNEINQKLPFNAKFQSGLINLLITDTSFFQSVVEDLSEKHFDAGEAYIKLVRLIKNYWKKTKKPLSIEIVKNYLIALVAVDVINKPEHHGMMQILETGRVLAPGEYDYIKDNVTDFLRKQTVALVFGEAINAYEKDDYDGMYKIMEDAYKKSFNIGDSIGVKYAEASITDTYSEPPRKDLWSSGFSQLDDYIDGGFARSECYTIISPTGRGKTSILCNFAVQAIKQHKKACFITLEMSEKQIEQRYDAITSGFSISEIAASGEVQVDLDVHRRKHIADKPIIKYFTRGTLTIGGLRNYLDKLFMNEGPMDVIFLDWIGCMKLRKSNEARFDEILAEAADELVNISRQYKVTLITSMQTNRSAVGNEEFSYSAVSSSFASLFGMDLVLGLAATDTSKMAGRRRLNILKNRMGPDSVYVNLLGDAPNKPLTFRFKEVPKEDEEASLLTEKEEKSNGKTAT